MDINYFLCRRQHLNTISKNMKDIQNTSELISTCMKASNIPQKCAIKLTAKLDVEKMDNIMRDLAILIDENECQISASCMHKIVVDYIDIPPDGYTRVKYCTICEKTFNM